MKHTSKKKASNLPGQQEQLSLAFEALQGAVADYEEKHPLWRLEVLASFIKGSVANLKHHIENPNEREITWQTPFVELRYSVDWDWDASSEHGDERDCMVFGTLHSQEIQNKTNTVQSISKIMVAMINTTALGEMTNHTRFAKRGDNYQTLLPIESIEKIKLIRGKLKKQAALEMLTKPFSIGATSIDFTGMNMTEGEPVPSEIKNKLGNLNHLIDIKGATFTGEINGHQIETSLIFQIHPLVIDFDETQAYFPLTVGLHFPPQFDGKDWFESDPSEWHRKDRDQFWKELFEALDTFVDKLVPKNEIEDSLVIRVNAELKIPTSLWKSSNQKKFLNSIFGALAGPAEVTSLHVQEVGAHCDKAGVHCQVCGWVHDQGLTQFLRPDGFSFSISGVLPDIVRCVHSAHSKGLPRLSTKDDALLKTCGGYSHPSKAFYDLRQSEAYRALFDTSRRGFIALRGFAPHRIET